MARRCTWQCRREEDRLTVASLEQIGEWLQSFDSEPEQVIARTLEYRGGGGSGAWTCDCDDDNQYIVKAQNNQHEHDEPRLKIVATELVCGRLGRLFTPPVTPESRVVILPSALTSAMTYPGTSKQPTAGTAFGSRLVEGVFETKSGNTDALAAEVVAAVVVFQTWLGAQDAAALVQVDTGSLFSMDHAWYLTGPQWQDNVMDANPIAISACASLIGTNTSRFRSRAVFAASLDQLADLGEESVVRAFSSIPKDWGADPAFRARLARYTLLCRDRVDEALSTAWKGTT